MSTTSTTYEQLLARYDALGPDHFADVLDGIATAVGASDDEIHRRSGISRQTINGMRAGRTPIRPDKLWPLASALDTDLEVFLISDPTEAVRAALAGRRYDRATRRFLPPGATGHGVEPRRSRARSRCTQPISSPPVLRIQRSRTAVGAHLPRGRAHGDGVVAMRHDT